MSDFDEFWKSCHPKVGPKEVAKNRFRLHKLAGRGLELADRWNEYADACMANDHPLCHISTWLSQKRFNQQARDFFTIRTTNENRTIPGSNCGLSDEDAAAVRKTHIQKSLLRAIERGGG